MFSTLDELDAFNNRLVNPIRNIDHMSTKAGVLGQINESKTVDPSRLMHKVVIASRPDRESIELFAEEWFIRDNLVFVSKVR